MSIRAAYRYCAPRRDAKRARRRLCAFAFAAALTCLAGVSRAASSVAAPAPAEGASRDLSISDAVAIALGGNLDIAAASRDLAAAHAQRRYAQSERLPKANLLASQTRLGGPLQMHLPTYSLDLGGAGPIPISLGSLGLAKQDESRVSVAVAIPLYTGGAIENGVAAAKFGEQASGKALAARSNDVAIETVQEYLRASLAAEVKQVSAETLDAVQHHLDDARKLYDAGVVAQFDVMRAEREVASQEKRLTDARNQHELAVEALLNTMNLSLDNRVNLTSPLVEYDYAGDPAQTSQDAVAASDAPAALRLKSKAQEAQGKVVGAHDKPQVTAMAMHQIYKADLTALEPNTAVMVAATIPLFDGGAARALQRQKREEASKSLADAQRVENLIRLGVRQAFDDLQSGRKGLAAADRSLLLAEEGLRLSSRRFETGVGTSVEKIDAILGVSQAKLERAGALYQIDSAYYRLLHLTNRLLPDMKKIAANKDIAK